MPFRRGHGKKLANLNAVKRLFITLHGIRQCMADHSTDQTCSCRLFISYGNMFLLEEAERTASAKISRERVRVCPRSTATTMCNIVLELVVPYPLYSSGKIALGARCCRGDWRISRIIAHELLSNCINIL